MSRRQTVAAHFSRQLTAKIAFAALFALSFCFAQTQTARAADKKPNYGRIEIATEPGGFPLLVDGKPAGETTASARLLDLPPGPHTVEVSFPNGGRWVREFNVVAGRKNCVALRYNARLIPVATSPCPYPVNVTAPASVTDGDTITFSSDVAYGGNSALNYTWTVSPPSAKIISGAGTPTITVDSTGLGQQSVTAILVVDDGSGESSCRQTAQAATNVIRIPPPPPLNCYDCFVPGARDEIKARLDNFASELARTPDATGYIITYGGRTSRTDQGDRLGAFARDYLVRERGIDQSRLVTVNGGYRESDYMELWIVPQGAQPPQAKPSVQPGDVRPAPGTTQPSRRRGSRRRR
jgi:hypothetical protein